MRFFRFGQFVPSVRQALPNSNETLKFVLNSGPRLQPTGLL
jgi:hypothetical protein